MAIVGWSPYRYLFYPAVGVPSTGAGRTSGAESKTVCGVVFGGGLVGVVGFV
jgi:hypothetical protein